MRHLVMRGDTVVNVILLPADPEPGTEYVPDDGLTLLDAEDLPHVGEGWTRDGEAWVPPAPAPQLGPRRVSKIDFRRLLTPVEAAKYRLLEAAPRVTAEDLAAAFDPETDPGEAIELQIRIAVEDAIQQFGLLPEFVELDHPDTAEFLGVMAAAGMFGAEAGTRIPQIIAGQAPS